MKRVFYLAIIFFVFFLKNGVYAGEPPREPILRIETGMHTSAIRSIGVDAESRYLVTGSTDKTVRVWELSTGRLLKIIRPPIGDGKEGIISAVAMSPDGRTIACAGWTGQDWDNKYASIYFFDRESGRLIKRISKLPSTTASLAYSKDGAHIVAGLGGPNGIRVYRSSDYSLVAEDSDYGNSIYGADFDIYGRLVTASYDGYIRLYDNSFTLIEKARVTGGKMPYRISFSPDSSKIAVGFADSRKVDVLSGRDISYLYSPDSSGVTGGTSAVSWSYDGKFLYAGAEHRNSALNDYLIRKWTDEGRGRYVDLSATKDTILQILPLRHGGIVFCSHDPAFGIFDAYDKRVVYKSPAVADYRNNHERFLVSYNASIVQFGYEESGKSPARFSVPDRLLESNPESSGAILNPPITSAIGLNIADWKDTYNPKVNGIALKLKQYELTRSVAISPDNQTFLLGTRWNLYLFDRYGNVKWTVPAP